MDTPRKQTRMKIIQDEVKLAHTSHWDLDYLGRDALEALMKRRGAESGGPCTPRSDGPDEHEA